MKIRNNVRLAPYTTFKIGGPARYFCTVTNEAEVVEAVTFARLTKVPFFVLGGGSNLLISDHGFPGLVMKNEIAGLSYEATGSSVLVRAGAGLCWDSIVQKTVSRGLYGLENLSAIPGTAGASAVQNIGAYGAEVGNLIRHVRAFDAEKSVFVDLSHAACAFSYRDSMFKQRKGRYVITAVTYGLSTRGNTDIEYKDLSAYFAEKGRSPTLAAVRRAVIAIRKRKLPDWKKWRTAGSFFKNPMLSSRQYASLKKEYPELPGFPTSGGKVKIQLAWILDKLCQARGLTVGHVGTFEKQALVVVAKAGATAEEVISFTNELSRCVYRLTGISVEAEVEWVN